MLIQNHFWPKIFVVVTEINLMSGVHCILVLFWYDHHYPIFVENFLRDAIHTHFVMQKDDTLFTHPPSLLFGPFQRRDKTFIFWFSHFATLIGPILDPPTHKIPFADKRDKAGMDGVPKHYQANFSVKMAVRIK